MVDHCKCKDSKFVAKKSLWKERYKAYLLYICPYHVKLKKELYNYSLSSIDDSIQDLIFMILSRYREPITEPFFHHRKAHTWYLASEQLFNIVISLKKLYRSTLYDI
jgi:hypothetical protein